MYKTTKGTVENTENHWEICEIADIIEKEWELAWKLARENPRKLCKIPEQDAKARKMTEKWVKLQNKVLKRGKSLKMCKIAGQNAKVRKIIKKCIKSQDKM